ncbi:MAG: ABC transporter permease [Clostridia bacterium]|nr:ABC transporter permease [Clostridia bacterium]
MKKEVAKPTYHTHITSKHKLFNLKLKEVWQYRDLIVLFTKRNFTVSYKQTILGPAWLFINPIITSLVYMVVFGRIANMSPEEVPEILFYMVGNAIWTFFSTCVTKNASTFTGNAAVFGKVYFPRLTTPISNMFSSVITFGIQMTLVIVLLVFYLIRGQVHPAWWAWSLIPLVLLNLGLLGMGLGIIVSSLTTKYRDLTFLIGFAVQLWMYVTPVVYPISKTDGILKIIMWINPVTAPVELFRYAILGQGELSWMFIGFSWAITIVALVIGIIIFNKVEKNFMDTV